MKSYFSAYKSDKTATNLSKPRRIEDSFDVATPKFRPVQLVKFTACRLLISFASYELHTGIRLYV